MNGRLRSPSSQCKLEERIHRYLKPGALAQIRDSRISARFRRHPLSNRTDSNLVPSSPSVSVPTQQHAVNDFPCFPSPRLFGPRCLRRKKIVGMQKGLVCPASSTPAGILIADDLVLELSKTPIRGKIKEKGREKKNGGESGRKIEERAARNLCESFRAGHDLEDLAGDLGLPLAVVGDGERALQLDGVIRGVAHSGHSGGEFAGQRLLQRPEDLAVKVEREQRVENLHGVLLELEDRRELRRRQPDDVTLDSELTLLGGQAEELVLGGIDAVAIDVADLSFRGERQESVDHGLRFHEGDELGVEELDLVDVLADKQGEDVVRDCLSLLSRRKGPDLQEAVDRDVGTAVEVGVALLSDGDDGEVEAKAAELGDAGLGLLDDIVVEAAAEATVAGNDDEGDLPDGADSRERDVDVVGLELLVDVVEDLDESLREGATVHHGLLGSPDLRGRHQLHGLRDLLRVLDGFDSSTELAEAADNS
ncbi:hypothetical protein EJ110_NYTH01070 [Nymphaea thermarum]|nr:hypothetical protein EJ110_NYTH01070 [Nymphaea thermarum]